MKMLGWELTQNATLLGPGGLRLNLPSASTKQIKQQLRIAWDWQCHREILHRKGVPNNPFDSHTTTRLMQKLTDRQRRILALSMTSGWQSLGAIAGWSATQAPECPWCHQYDTHTHQLLHCPVFQDIREQHADAVAYMTQHHHICWFPLPCHHPNVELVRQAMHLRHHNLAIHSHIPLHPQAVIYTDGTCDDTRDPYSARAAWAAIIYNPTLHSTPDPVFQVLAAGHCPGSQTINRSELYAMVVAVEYAATQEVVQAVTFVTDSQFVTNCIHQIEDNTISHNPHRKSHWDLMKRLLCVWDASRFTILKIKSHTNINDSRNIQEALHIRGNDLADKTAGRVRNTDDPDFDALCRQTHSHLKQQQAIFDKIYQYFLDIAYARMTKLDEGKSKPALHSTEGPLSSQEVDIFTSQITKLRNWTIQGNSYILPDEPHRVVFWCSVWGTNLTYLVWQFCKLLVWPRPDSPPQRGDPGISWTELAISFMLWSNRYLPIRIKEKKGYKYFDYTNPAVSLLPIKAKSIRVLAENFRWVVKHIQTFSRTQLIPSFKKQGTSSLTRLGFTSDHEGGLSRRPQLPNTEATCTYLHDMLKTMPHNPPFHTDFLAPPLPAKQDQPDWPNWPEVEESRRDAFVQHVRYVLFKKKDFDTVIHPKCPVNLL